MPSKAIYDDFVHFRCKGPLKEDFVKKCTNKNQVPADVHRELMRRYANGTIAVRTNDK